MIVGEGFLIQAFNFSIAYLTSQPPLAFYHTV